MRISKSILTVALILTACLSAASAAPATRQPHIAYAIPAGGQQGATFDVIVGGQFLRAVKDVHITGKGVSAKVIKHYYVPRFVPQERRMELARHLVEIKEKRLAELGGIQAPLLPGEWQVRRQAKQVEEGVADPPDPGLAILPDHPMLRDLQDKSLREVQHIANMFLDWQVLLKNQPNAQLQENVLIRVEIDAKAEPGNRELRLGLSRGITNPTAFQVGVLPETHEAEPNDPGMFKYLPEEAPLTLPIVVNGQVMPGDVDRFRFEAKQGQRLVIEVAARRLVPFLADAVPGWFQAVLTLYDSQGREVAFADDYRFHPDPVIFYEVPEDGVYELEIRDSIYRGREDFVYRVSVSEQPFITEVFPLGGQVGTKTIASTGGWNLPVKRLKLNVSPGAGTVRRASLCMGKIRSNEIVYAVDTLPECFEKEANNDRASAQQVDLPKIVNGRISKAGDVDVFKFKGRAGDEVVAEVMARRLHSPMDSVIRLTDAAGRVIEWNDDVMQRAARFLHPDMGLLTHHADSCLKARLPKAGTYYVSIADAQSHGGDAYAYRLRLSAPRHDFDLRMTPSSLSIRAGGHVPITVHALRKDGFDGEIAVSLRDAPEGFTLAGAAIPSGRDSIRMTIRAPDKPLGAPAALTLEGRATIDGKTVVRTAIPCDDVMQAFLFRHLAPCREWSVQVGRGWTLPSTRLTGESPVRVPAGGAAEVLLTGVKQQPVPVELELVLHDPPQGVTLSDTRLGEEGLTFHLNADGSAPQAGFADNAIIEVFKHVEQKPKEGDAANTPPKKRKASLGMLPAIPYLVVGP